MCWCIPLIPAFAWSGSPNLTTMMLGSRQEATDRGHVFPLEVWKFGIRCFLRQTAVMYDKTDVMEKKHLWCSRNLESTQQLGLWKFREPVKLRVALSSWHAEHKQSGAWKAGLEARVENNSQTSVNKPFWASLQFEVMWFLCLRI